MTTPDTTHGPRSAPEDTRPTMAELVAAWGVRITILKATRTEDGTEWTFDIVMSVAGTRRTLTGVPYTVGSVAEGCPPTAADYLDAVASDARAATDTFAEFEAEYGPPIAEHAAATGAEQGIPVADAIGAVRYRSIWHSCRKVRNRLKVILGPDRLDVLLAAVPL